MANVNFSSGMVYYEHYKLEPVVRDGNIITARGPYYAVYFALEIVRYLLGEDKAEELKGNILLNEGLQVKK